MNSSISTTSKYYDEKILIGLIIFSFFGMYIGFFSHSFYLLTICCLIGAFSILIAEILFRSKRIKQYALALLVIATFTIAFGVLYNKSFPTAYLFLLFFCLLVVFFSLNKYTHKQMLAITNLPYLVYAALSILVNLGVIPVGRAINSDDVTTVFGNANAFVGFFGSTAHIDSYSILVLLINLYFNPIKRNKLFFLFLTGTIAFITFRTTPILVGIGSVLCAFVLNKLKWKIFGEILLITIFLSFLTPLVIYILTQDRVYLILLDYLLTGRASLWVDIWNIYTSKSILDMLIGFSGVEGFSVMTWGFAKANPHNLYLNFLILYGAAFFIIFFLFVRRVFFNLSPQKKTLLIAILLGGVGNSALIGFSNLPITIWLAYLLCHEK
ncbi:MAG: hypothetical protein ABJF11_07565 [Reichenbachiella sp.]|uniref:hypothetical protein n=1 Tax=Reichenbachiella sp. TaxID=2184521 RepID=UPI0032646620